MQISFNSRAKREVTSVADRYDDESPGLGPEFLVQFERVLDIIEAHGARMAVFRRDVRVVRLNRFPYGVYYRVTGDTARVLTVKHLHRDPDFGLDRT